MQQFVVGASRIVVDEWNRVLVEGRVLRLAPQEQALLVALLRQMARHQQEVRARFWVRIADLQQVMGASSAQRIQVAAFAVRALLWPYAVDIKSVHGEGYFIWEQAEEG